MLYALEQASGEAFSGEYALVRGHAFARACVCPDPDCSQDLSWKPGHGGRAPHWAHRPGATACGGGAMTLKHQLAQSVMENLDVWTWARREQFVSVPDHELRTLTSRRIDVAVKFDSAGTSARASIECQHSTTDLRSEELRIQDHNLVGLPVLLVVSSECIRDAGNGFARPDFWVREWARRHGRQQVAAIDDDGTVWWCWFATGCEDTKVPTTRVRIRPGTTSADGCWRMGITVDRTTPERATGAPSLLIAAFSWVRDDRTVRWPNTRPYQRPEWQPERQPQPCHLGSRLGKSLFCDDEFVTGGF